MPHDIPENAPDPLKFLADQPDWLKDIERKDPRELLERLFKERTSFYPGAGTDGQLFEVFGQSRSVRCHVHADLNVSADVVLNELNGEHGVLGYDVIYPRILKRNELEEWESPHEVEMEPQPIGPPQPQKNLDEQPDVIYWESGLDNSLIAVLRRKDEFNESHGPEFQCFLHIQADAYWTYWNLWGIKRRAPYAMILQDCGGVPCRVFGGRNSFIFRCASYTKSLPKFLLVAENTEHWPGYHPVAGWTRHAGLNRQRRCLYQID